MIFDLFSTEKDQRSLIKWSKLMILPTSDPCQQELHFQPPIRSPCTRPRNKHGLTHATSPSLSLFEMSRLSAAAHWMALLSSFIRTASWCSSCRLSSLGRTLQGGSCDHHCGGFVEIIVGNFGVKALPSFWATFQAYLGFFCPNELGMWKKNIAV